MTSLEQLTIKYLKKRDKSVLDINKTFETDIQGLMIERFRKYCQFCEDKGFYYTRKQLKSMDMIDFSKVLDMESVGYNSAALPPLGFSDDEKAKIDSCWHLIIPPFKEGVIRINRHRYIHYMILKIDEEDKSYMVWLRDYAYDKVWTIENLCAGYFKWDNAAVGDMKCVYNTSGSKMSEIIEETLKDHPTDFTKDDLLYYKEVLIPYIRCEEEDSDLDSLLVHFALIVIKTNLQLLQGKPKAKRGSGNKIKTVAGEVIKNPKPKIIRTLIGGIEITSEKIPRASSADTIRKYNIEAWKTRGHIRHYKSGKTVWVRESVHHRKCLDGKGATIIPQTIIRVENLKEAQ